MPIGSAPMAVQPAGPDTTPARGTEPAFPVADWQFWIVTLVAMLAFLWLVHKALPGRLFGSRRGRAKPATLTVGGKAIDRSGPPPGV